MKISRNFYCVEFCHMPERGVSALVFKLFTIDTDKRAYIFTCQNIYMQIVSYRKVNSNKGHTNI